MIHFWRKPGKTLICILTLFMTVALLGIRVYALDDGTQGTGNENNPAPGQTEPVSDASITPLLQDGVYEDLKQYLEVEENKGNLVVDLYEVASFSNYKFTDTKKFDLTGHDLNKDFVLHITEGEGGTTTDDASDLIAKWDALAQVLAGQVRDKDITPNVSTILKQKSDGLEPGLYLILARDKDLTGKDQFEEIDVETGEATSEKLLTTVMNTEANKYNFRPVLVVVPSKSQDANQKDPSAPEMHIATSDEGKWIYDVNVYLKPTQAPLYGSLVINKKIVTLNNRPIDEKWITPVTVVFRINGWKDERKTGEPFYSNYASITIPNGTPVTVEHIPVGTYVEVEEEYTGAGYTRVLDGEGPILTAVIPAPDEGTPQVTFTFKDTYNDELKKGYGIMNTFTKTDADNWSWKNDVGQNSSGTNPAEGGPQE